VPEPDRRSGLEPQSSLGYQVNHLARLLAYRLRERIERIGVVPGQFAQLLALYQTDGLTQAELCERVQIEQPTMANTLARMERDGLITREPDPHDRRRSRVLLTERAREFESSLVAAAREVNALATAGLRPREIDSFMATMATLIANLGNAGSGAVEHR
jgi:DNA-binding MarR family transcriptional regulator